MRDGMATQTSGAQFLSGRPAQVLAANNWNVSALRTNSLLQKDEWVRLDQEVIEVARQRLGVVNTLRQYGLVFPAGNLGVLSVEWERLSDFTEANQDMGLETRGERDRPTWDLQSIPIPITHKEFEVNIRHLEASRQRGAALDTTAGALAGMVVAEKLEDTVLNGSNVQIGGSRAYGFRNFTDRQQGSLTGDWTDSDDSTGVSGEEIVQDVLAMITKLEGVHYYGPYEMLVGTAYNARLRDDFKDFSDKTIRDRLLEIDSLQGITVSAKIPKDEVILFQTTRNVVDLAVIQDIVTVEWAEMGGFIQQFVVFAAMAPRMKSDRKGQSGIAHFTHSE